MNTKAHRIMPGELPAPGLAQCDTIAAGSSPGQKDYAARTNLGLLCEAFTALAEK